MIRKLSLFGLLSLAFLLAISCFEPEKKSGSTQNTIKDKDIPLRKSGPTDPIAVPEAMRGGAITMWGGPFPKSLNMWLDYNSFSVQVCGMMFEPLMTMHSVTNDPVPVIAKSFERSDDGMEYTFYLDSDAKWSDGRQITAEDVQFYYDVMMDENNLTSLFRVGLSYLERPIVVDKTTLKVKAKRKHWKIFWTASSMSALPKHAWKDKDFNRINFEFDVVSGPYRLADVREGRLITLERRPDWWGRAIRFNVGKYNFDRITFKSVNDRDKALKMLEGGELDILAVYTARDWAVKSGFPEVEKAWVVRQEVTNKEPKGFSGMAINMRKKMFKDLRVREAMALLLNRHQMNDKFMFNQYLMINSYYPDLYPGSINPEVPVTKFNREKARKLLSDAGWKVNDEGHLEKDGKAFSINIMTASEDLRHMNLLVQDLKSVGIQATIERLSQSQIRKRLDEHDFEMHWLSWGASRLRDPESMWSSTTAGQKATQNVSGVQDEEIDRLIESQIEEYDPKKRTEILKKIDARLVEIQPYALMWSSEYHRLLYWNKFGTPESVLDKFNREDSALVYWWVDPEKEKALKQAMEKDNPLPKPKAQVGWDE